jgi:hypothetical protein
MAPMRSITAVTAEPGPLKTSLVITTAVGIADFLVDPQTAEKARTLLLRLIAEAAAPVDSTSDDELINLTWNFDARVVDPADLDDEPRRLLGF